MNIAISSDHAGYPLRKLLEGMLAERGIAVEDFGAAGESPSVDYPDFVQPVTQGVLSGRFDRGILICGSGQGMAISANRFRGIRAALCESPLMARMSRAHNDSNVLCMGARLVTATVAEEILKEWLDTPFEGGRHQGRVAKMDAL